MPLRILHAISSVNPAGGGPIEGLKQLETVNRRFGHEVEVACLDAPSDPWVKDFPLPCHAMGPAISSYRYSPRFIPWLRENHERFDCVIVNGLWQFNGFGVWKALADTQTPYFVFPHGMLDPWFKKRYPLKYLKKWLYWPWGEYRVLRDARAVLFTCEEERRLARRSFWLYHCDEFVVSYGTSGPVGDPTSQAALFRRTFPETSGKRPVLFLGRVHEKKGADLLIRAFASLVKSEPALTADRHLVLAGPNDHSYGREMSTLVESLGISDRVTWTGMVTGDLKWGAFHAADVFSLPSHQENFGISVAEALGAALPVLITPQVNIWREIQQEHAGLVEPDTLEGTIAALRAWFLLDPEKASEMRRNALRAFQTRFHIEPAAISLIYALRLFGVKDSITERPLDANGLPITEDRRRPGSRGRRSTDR